MGITQEKLNQPTAVAAQAINSLGIELLTLATTPGENALLSPYSIQSVLAMVYAGAEGETWAEMQRVLYYPQEKGELHDSFESLRIDLELMAVEVQGNEHLNPSRKETKAPFVLSMANRLYGQTGFEFRQQFLSFLREKYGTTLETMDFVSDPAGAAKLINGWVEEQTAGKIRDVILPEAMNKATRLVLINAIYLKARWENRFAKTETHAAPFYMRGQIPEEVPTMERLANLGFRKEDGYCVVAMPYFGREVQFLILLPDSRDGLAEMERRVTQERLAGCQSLPVQEVRLFLPKFELATPTYDLSEVMKDFGIKQAFDEPKGSANFEGIAPRWRNDYLALSKLLHQAYLKVDEEGTEAAAVSIQNVIMEGIDLEPPKPIEVRVDRPFLFAIQHKASGACLFMGRVVDPR